MNHLPESARRRLRSQVADQHPDAGLLTAFAEQTLTVSERELVLNHLAACARCREVVSLALPAELPTEAAAPVAPSSFRWPMLRWAAMAATAVIVWAAVSVLVPRTANRDVSVPADSSANIAMQKVAAPAATNTPQQAPAAAVVAPARKSLDLPVAADRKAMVTRSNEEARDITTKARPTARDAVKEESAKDQNVRAQADLAAPANRVIATDKAASRSETFAFPGTTVSKLAPPPAPSPGQKKSKTDEMSGAAAGVPMEAERQPISVESIQKAGAVGGPVQQNGVITGGQRTTAVIAGKITDPSGAVVPNALVKITNAQTSNSTAVRTDAAGTYRTPVTPGVYSVEASSPGMQTAKADGITIEGTVAQNLTLRVGAATEAVEVTSAAALATAAPNPPPPAAMMAKMPGELKANAPAGQAGADGSLAAAKSKRSAIPLRWRVSEHGALEQSLNGTSWTTLDTAPKAVFRTVATIGPQTWAGGEGGALYRSSDGGRTWERIPVGPKDAPVTETISTIAFSTPSAGTVTTASGAVWSTRDAGRSWQRP